VQRTLWGALAAVGVAVAAVAALLGPATAATRPATIVVLGDSAASGEGAGDYVKGTRGEGGDWCHRSPHAYAYATGLAPTAVDLACSGARAADVGLGGGRDGEPSQAVQLRDVAGRNRVTTVVVQVGADDDVALIRTGVACVASFLSRLVPPCRDTIGPLVPSRAAATAGKVEAAVRDVRTVMRQVGYGDGSYTLVLLSYASPITEQSIPFAAVRGCPYSRADAAWGRTTLIPALSTALAGVATRTGAAFLDLSRAAEGREACSRDDPTTEWQRRVTVDPAALVDGGSGALGYHLAQESFHPSAGGHAAIAACLAAFVRSGKAVAACVPDGSGGLRLGPPTPPAPVSPGPPALAAAG
jgi:lysophospholipase L1-like esterase